MEQTQRQQVMVNDLACYISSFVSPTPANSPLRRRRQRSPQLASCSKEVTEVERGAVAAPAERTGFSRHHFSRGGCSTPGPARPGPSLLAPSPTYDSLFSPSRKFLRTHKSRADSPFPGSPLARTPRQRNTLAECAPRAHSDVTVHQTAADASTMRRSRSEPLSFPAKALRLWAKRPVDLARAPPPSNKSDERFSTRTPHDSPRWHVQKPVSLKYEPASEPLHIYVKVTNADVGMLALWNHSDEMLVII